MISGKAKELFLKWFKEEKLKKAHQKAKEVFEFEKQKIN